MLSARIAIIGGGLSGLYAASLLEQQGITDYLLLEARAALGGRIQSASLDLPNAPASLRDRFDLGPTWFWPAFQPELNRLIRDLGLERFAQYETGDMMIERSPHEPPTRARGYATSPTSMRLVGGMGALIDALRRALEPSRILTGHQVRRVRRAEQHIELDAEGADGQMTSYRVEHVLLAMPPRLAVATIDFTPALPAALVQAWRDTATWMAPHAKYVAVYETPFWRELGLSGEARSGHGPLGEIHDASMPGGSAALFGFFGIPAHIRRDVADDVLLAHCRAQFVRLFGSQAATPKAEFIKDWATDAYTSDAAYQNENGQHGAAPPALVTTGDWRNRLIGIASEWSPQFPGYVAGAIEAASLGVSALMTNATLPTAV